MAGQPGRSGGPRTGTPGKAYANRIDLPAAAPGQPYGVAGQQAAAQRVIPLPMGQGAPQGDPMQEAPLPPVVPLDAPTQRPDEPVTAGMPFGDGPGPPPMPDPNQQSLQWLQSIYQVAPSNDLLEVIMQMEAGQ